MTHTYLQTDPAILQYVDQTAPNVAAGKKKFCAAMSFDLMIRRQRECRLAIKYSLHSMPYPMSIRYTQYDEHGTVIMGRYQDPGPQLGQLISNF